MLTHISLNTACIKKNPKYTELLWVCLCFVSMSELRWEVINRERAGFDERSEIAFPLTCCAVDP